MTRPMRNPTFTLDELRVIHRALMTDRSGRVLFSDIHASTLTKIANAIEYRKDTKTKQQRERYG